MCVFDASPLGTWFAITLIQGGVVRQRFSPICKFIGWRSLDATSLSMSASIGLLLNLAGVQTMRIKRKKTSNPSLETIYLELTEHLVSRYQLSLFGLFGCRDSNAYRPPALIPLATHHPHHLLSPAQTSALLGLSEQTLAAWRANGMQKLAYLRVGRSIRYRYEDVLAFIKNHRGRHRSQR